MIGHRPRVLLLLAQVAFVVSPEFVIDMAQVVSVGLQELHAVGRGEVFSVHHICLSATQKTNQYEHEQTRRECPKSGPYLRLKNIQGTTIGNAWKKLIFFSKKKIFFTKSGTMPKNSKRGRLGSLNVFTNRKLQKMQGGTL